MLWWSTCGAMGARTKKTPVTLHWQRLRAKGDPRWYQAYLRSHHWRQLRKRAIAQARYRCRRCGRADERQDKKKGSRLNVHHQTYERVGAERPGDLEVLCWRCHQAVHHLD